MPSRSAQSATSWKSASASPVARAGLLGGGHGAAGLANTVYLGSGRYVQDSAGFLRYLARISARIAANCCPIHPFTRPRDAYTMTSTPHTPAAASDRFTRWKMRGGISRINNGAPTRDLDGTLVVRAGDGGGRLSGAGFAHRLAGRNLGQFIPALLMPGIPLAALGLCGAGRLEIDLRQGGRPTYDWNLPSHSGTSSKNTIFRLTAVAAKVQTNTSTPTARSPKKRCREWQ